MFYVVLFKKIFEQLPMQKRIVKNTMINEFFIYKS